MKKILFIGQTGCGKTTLCQRLENMEVQYKKTQQVTYSNLSIDTPGEYVENRGYHNSLVIASADAEVIAFVHDITDDSTFFPPLFSSRFTKPVVGILTKLDLVESEVQIEKGRHYLKLAGVSKIFTVGKEEDKGILEIRAFLVR